MAYTASFDENLSTQEKQSALQALWKAIKAAMTRMKTAAKDLKEWLKTHTKATVQKFKTAEGIEALLISTGTGLFIGSLVYNTIVAIAAQQVMASLTIAAASAVGGLIAAGASALLASLAGIAAIGIVPLGVGASGSTILATLGGAVGAWGTGALVSSALAPGLATKALIATGIVAAPLGAPIAAIGAGLIAGGAALWGLTKLLKKNDDKDNSEA